MAFVGVRGDESRIRSFYEDASDGAKNASQINLMPILDWGAHEIWLYIFANGLIVNRAYRKGFSRVGCLVCPEASNQYAALARKIYPCETKRYCDAIIRTSRKSFIDADDEHRFLDNGWQARKNGAVLREPLAGIIESSDGLALKFQSADFSKERFLEWIKTIGNVSWVGQEANRFLLKLRRSVGTGIPVAYEALPAKGGLVTFEFSSQEEKGQALPAVRSLFRKVAACIACRCCEAECAHGAISVEKGKLKVDGDKCVKCGRCHGVRGSCWRYSSLKGSGSKKQEEGQGWRGQR